MATGIPVTSGELVDVAYLNEVARAHYRKTTAKTVAATVTETDLLNGEIALGAGVAGTSRVIRATMWGDWKQNSGATTAVHRFKIYLGASGGILDTGALAGAFGNSATRGPWKAVVEIALLGAANSLWVTLDFWGFLPVSPVANVGAAFTTGEGSVESSFSAVGPASVRMQGGVASAVDMASSQVLAFAVINPSANAAVDCVLKAAVVEIV